MASIAYPTSLPLAGPWLLESKNLRELDSVVDSCVRIMQQKRDESVEVTVAEENRELLAEGKSEEFVNGRTEMLRGRVKQRFPFYGEKRQLTVYLSGGRTVNGSTFSGLMALPHVNEEIPRGFSVQAAIGLTEIKVAFGSMNSSDLEISASSTNDDVAQELFGIIQNWASELQPKKWLQMWLKTDLLSGFLITVAGAIYLTILGLMLIPEAGPSQVRQQARDLAKQGVNSSNETTALQLLLSIESGYEPNATPSVHHYPGPRFWAYSILLLLTLLGFNRPPKGAIGIWGGKRALDRQRRWIRVVSISIPSFAAGSLLIPYLTHWLGWTT